MGAKGNSLNWEQRIDEADVNRDGQICYKEF